MSYWGVFIRFDEVDEINESISSQRTRGLRGSERTHESDQNNHSVRAGDGRYGEKGSQEKDIYLGAVSSCVGGSVGVLC